jgi:transposase
MLVRPSTTGIRQQPAQTGSTASSERALGKRLDTRGVLAVLQHSPSGPAVKDAGVQQLTAALKAQRVHRAEAFATQLHQAAMAQTVTIIGSATAAVLISELAVQLAAILARRDTLEQEIEQGFFALPEATILGSLPGIGPRLGARIAVEIGSITRFRTPGHLAAYAGLGPTPWKSGTSIKATMPSHFCNHRLKNALFVAAFASLRREPSRTYYDRKRVQGKVTTKLCSASLGVESTSCMRCSAAARPTARRLASQRPLDK